MSRRLTTQKFIDKAKHKHGDKYNYSNTSYGTSNVDKVEIICSEHGSFWQAPNSHLSGQGCPRCGKIQSVKSRTYGTKNFIKKAKNIHNNFYDYSLSKYINSQAKIKIICPHHGVFEQKPNGHLQGQGCYQCGVDSHYSTISDFIKKAKGVYGDKYNYDNSYFIKYRTGNKVNITCPEHGDFIIWKSSFLKGFACKECSNGYAGFSKTGWIKFCKKKGVNKAYCYIIRLYDENESFIKVGISTDIKSRFRHIPYNYEIIYLIEDVPEKVFTKEKLLHRIYKPEKYKPLRSFDGKHECFTLNIFK